MKSSKRKDNMSPFGEKSEERCISLEDMSESKHDGFYPLPFFSPAVTRALFVDQVDNHSSEPPKVIHNAPGESELNLPFLSANGCNMKDVTTHGYSDSSLLVHPINKTKDSSLFRKKTNSDSMKCSCEGICKCGFDTVDQSSLKGNRAMDKGDSCFTEGIKEIKREELYGSKNTPCKVKRSQSLTEFPSDHHEILATMNIIPPVITLTSSISQNKNSKLVQDNKQVETKQIGYVTQLQPSKRPKRKVSFTVTRVDSDDEDENKETSMITNGDPLSCTASANQKHIPSENQKLNIPEPTTPLSDSESAYGDTLTQSSITALLSKKFKTYKTYKYDQAPKNKGRSKSFSGVPSNTDRPRSQSQSEARPGLRKRLISRYESQDYDQCENTLFLKEQEKERALKVRRKWMARWIVNLMTGVGTALVATVIEVCIEYSSHYKFWVLKKMVTWCDTGWCMSLPLVIWISINCSLVCLGSMLVTYVEPQATGSGIPQIKCYLNGVKIPGLLTLRALIAKALGVILSVSGGLACGKEGPMIHSGAIVAAGVSQGRSRWLKRDFKIFEYLRSDTERRDFVSGGASAGVSAAFGAPVGGVLFSLEEGASFWNQSLTWRIVFASMVATFTVNVILSAIHGHPADLSNPGLISFGHFPHITYQAIEIPIFLFMAVVGGLLGAAFNGINSRLTIFRKRYITRKCLKVLEAVIVAAMSAVLGFSLIYFVNDCAPDGATRHHQESTLKMNCPEGYHNVMSAIFLKSPESSLVSVLHDEIGSYSVLTLCLFAVSYFFLHCWTYGLSVSSGVFIPSLLTGATWGRLVGMGVMYLFPTMGNNIGKYALIGAASQLGGTVRMTISLTVILIECTGDITFGLPIVMVLIIAKWVGDCFNSGLYDMHIQLMGIPLLPWEPPEMSYDITAKQLMNSPVIVLRSVEKVSRIVEVLENMPHLHSGFPVVEDYDPDEDKNKAKTSKEKAENGNGETPVQETVTSDPVDPKEGRFGRCKGLILRSQLCLLLQHKVFIDESGERRKTQHSTKELKLEDFRDVFPQISSKTGFSLTAEEKELLIDLTPYMNPTPYTVPLNASLPRMFRLFRGLGLRHLIAVNDKNEVCGMVTRKDLAKYRLNSKGANLTIQELHIHHD